jgi:methionine-rich copper-binding protein CopC
MVLVAGVFYITTRDSSKVEAPTVNTQTTPQSTPAKESADLDEKQADSGFKQESFDNIKSAHYVSSDPANNALLTKTPAKVTVKFNFNLATGSKISVSRDGNDVTSGSTQISTDKLSMSTQVNANKTGNYKVSYTACWPDGSCHDGSFGFSIELP